MEYFVAESYRGCERIGEPIEENGKLYIKIRFACPRCGGVGKVPYRVDQGICYKCNGGKYLTDTVRLYTQAEIDNQKRAREKAKEKKIRELEAETADNRKRWFTNHGFNEDGITYLICGDTYDIKNDLKVLGAKFDCLLKWHAPTKLELPQQYTIIEISFDDIYCWGSYCKSVSEKPNAKSTIENKMPHNDTSKYIGAVGDKLSNIEATLIKTYCFDGYYGYQTLFTFKTAQDDIVTWTTSTFKDIHEGERFLISGTVKDLKEYKGKKQTVLTRCKLSQI